MYRNSHTRHKNAAPRRDRKNLIDVPDIARPPWFAFHHLEFDGLASLANVLGKDRAFLDALEDLLGREQH
jgi:hypothetical protein